MRKTNLESSYRQKNQESCCSFRGLLYSKATLFFALLLLPALIFAQSNKQQQLTEKEARNQAYLDAKYGNKVELDQPMVFQRQAVQQTPLSTQSVSTEAERILQKEEIRLQNKGLSEIQIQAEMNAIENPESIPLYYARQGSNDCSNAVEIDCNDGAISGSTSGFSNAGFINCGGGASLGNGVWYVMTGDNANNVISVTGSGGFAPRVHVYSGSCGALQCQGGVAGQGTGSASFFAAGGDTYYLYVTGGATAVGAYQIEVTSSNCQAPTGDGLSSATALPVGCGDVVSGDTTGFGNTEAGRVDCNTNFSTGQVGVWYTMNVTSDFVNGTGVVLDLCGSGFDTEVSVYSGDNLDCVGFNDDLFSQCGSGNASYFEFDAQPNTDYYIYIAGFSDFSNGTGPYEMQVLCDGVAPPPPPSIPANDLCADAIDLDCGETLVDQSTILATGGSSSSCFGSIGNDVWYLVAGTGFNLNLTVNATGDEELQVEVYEVIDANCDNFTLGSCTTGADGFSNPSVVDFLSDENMVYYVRVGSWISSSPDTTFDITLTCQDPPTPPDNDNCEDAETIVCGDTVSGDTYLATNAGVPFCDSDAATNSPGVWYAFEGTGDIVDLDLEGVNYDAVISVYTGGCDGLTCVIGENGDFSDDSSVRFLSESGTDYLIFVSGFFGAVGDFNLEISCQPDPCSIAIPISCGGSDTGNIGGENGSTAGPDTSVSCGTTPGPRGYFYVLEGEGQFVNVSACNSTFDTKLNVYSGSCNELVCVTGNDDTFGGQCGSTRSAVDFFAEDGETYYIWLSGFSLFSSGSYEIVVSCQDAVENDLCDAAVALSCGTTLQGSTVLSTDRDAPESVCDGAGDAEKGVWYTIEGTGGDIILSTCGAADFDTKILVFASTDEDNPCDDLNCIAGNDDAVGCSGGTSTVQFATDSGVTYYVYVTGFGTQVGTFEISVECPCFTASTECVTLYDGYDPTSSTTLTGVLQGGAPVVSYNWNTGATTPSIDVFAADGTQQYSVTMVDADGCSSTQEFFVYVVDIDCDRGNSDKIEICHNGTTICVSVNAAQAHLNHGDSLGACGTESCDEQLPFCDANVLAPADGESDVSIRPSISWSSATGIVDGYLLNVETSGGVAVIDSQDVGDVLSFDIDFDLDYETTYVVTVTPYNVNGSASGCSLSSFTTVEDPLPNDDCDGAVGLTVNASDNPCAVVYETDHTDATDSNATFSCDTTGVNLDSWYTFVAPASGSVDVEVTNGSQSGTTEMALFDSCSGTQLACASGTDQRFEGLTAGTTYTLAIWYDDFNTEGTFTICVNEYTPPPARTVTCGSPENTVYCYGNNDTTQFQFTSDDGSPLEVVFNSGTIESCCDDIIIYDGLTTSDPVLYSGNNGGDLAGLTVNGTSDSIMIVVDSDFSVSCGSGSRTEWDFDVDCYVPGPETSCENSTTVTGFTYSNSTTESFVYTSTDGSAINVEFTGGRTENNFDELIILDTDGSQLYNGYGNSGDLTGLSFQASGDTITVRVTPDSSVNSSLSNPWSYVVSWTCTTEEVCAETTDVTGFTYTNSTTESFVYTSTDGSPIKVDFISGRTENNFDELIILDTDGSQLYSGYGNSGDLTGLSFQASGDTITVRVTPDSSVNSSTSNPWSYTVSWACTGGPEPEVCDNSQVITGYTYTNSTTESFVYTSTDGSAIKVEFNSGRTENNFDELIILDTDGTQLYNGYGASGDLTGLSFQASGDTITVRVTPDSSVNSSISSPWNYTVSWTCSGGGAREAAPLAEDLEWTMYPNPSKGQVKLDLKDFVNNDINVQVIDLRGNVILNRTVQNLQDPKLQIELNNVPYGMYLVRVQSNDSVSTKRLIINN
ncbi:T9SS type A sorting domain-containing protein [Hanstruepera ponticola]|uniref:T9SS type A sorting domain-containing protein n=1 Tax=Hanstruepera ponticola TaxID=2042995 RepID=UPI000CF0CB16|nr:T9SS type A sorting domain-containing protein [Hanstruepera ponticola]